jgi:hypothetical protein
MYILVDESQRTQGQGTADHTTGIMKWGGVDKLSSASAVRRPFASGHSLAAETD